MSFWMIAAYFDARELSLSQGERRCKRQKIVRFGGFKLLWFGSAQTLSGSPPLLYSPKRKNHPMGGFLFLVEARGVEPLSENLLTRLSTSVVDVLTFPLPNQLPPTGSGLW